MMKLIVFVSLLLAVSAHEQKSNIIQYEDIRPIQRYPYLYRGDIKDEVVEPEPVIISAPSTEVSASLFSTAVTCVIDLVKSTVVFMIMNSPAIISGAIVGLGVCKLTALCDSQVSIYEVQKELKSYATPERISRAAKFVKEAIEKYNNIQKK